jgi:hypothetical protein
MFYLSFQMYMVNLLSTTHHDDDDKGRGKNYTGSTNSQCPASQSEMSLRARSECSLHGVADGEAKNDEEEAQPQKRVQTAVDLATQNFLGARSECSLYATQEAADAELETADADADSDAVTPIVRSSSKYGLLTGGRSNSGPTWFGCTSSATVLAIDDTTSQSLPTATAMSAGEKPQAKKQYQDVQPFDAEDRANVDAEDRANFDKL